MSEGEKMQLMAKLSEADIRLAIDMWMYNRHNAVIKTGKDIVFYIDSDSSGSGISATVAYDLGSNTQE